MISVTVTLNVGDITRFIIRETTMAKIFIVHPNGAKTLVTREQMVELALKGQITPESQLGVIGRVVPARKIKELNEIFAEKSLPSGSQPSAFDFGNASSSAQNDEAVPQFAPPEFDFDAPTSSVPTQANVAPPLSSELTPPPVVEASSKITSFVQKFVVRETASSSDSVVQRARARTKSMTMPFIWCKNACVVMGVISAIGSSVTFIIMSSRTILDPLMKFGDKLGTFLITLVAFLGALIATFFIYYVVWGVFNYIVQYAQMRAEDSIRQEDFYREATRLLKEQDDSPN